MQCAQFFYDLIDLSCNGRFKTIRFFIEPIQILFLLAEPLDSLIHYPDGCQLFFQLLHPRFEGLQVLLIDYIFRPR